LESTVTNEQRSDVVEGGAVGLQHVDEVIAHLLDGKMTKLR